MPNFWRGKPLTMTERAIPTMLSVADARARLVSLAQARPLASESVELACAINRVIAADIIAPIALPPFANSAMDGFAIRGEAIPTTGRRKFRLVGTRLAGSAGAFTVGEGECVRITTGAAIPIGADTVVIKENVEVDGDRVWINAAETPGANVRSAGEDLASGALAFAAGTRINPARLGLLASLGMARVNVIRRPRVALLTTGNELIAPGKVLLAGHIYNSNGYSLASQLLRLGAEMIVPDTLASNHASRMEINDSELRFLHVRDNEDSLRASLKAAASVADIVISSGGVSAGEADFLPNLLIEIGTVHFWKVKMRPGMPLLCGEVDNAMMIGLPGNPVSSLAILAALVAPALARMEGVVVSEQTNTLRVCIDRDWEKRHDRTEFLRARLQSRDDGSLWATPVTRQGSGMLAGMAEADVLLEVEEHMRHIPAGTVLKCLRLD